MTKSNFKLYHRHLRAFSLSFFPPCSFLETRLLPRPIFFRRRNRIQFDIACDSSPDLSRINCAERYIVYMYVYKCAHTHIRAYAEKSLPLPGKVRRRCVFMRAGPLVKPSGKLVAKVVRESSTSAKHAPCSPALVPLSRSSSFGEQPRVQQPGRRAAIFRTSASRRTFLDYKSRRRCCIARALHIAFVCNGARRNVYTPVSSVIYGG